MNYQQIYDTLISTRKQLNRKKSNEFENHHIIPKCFSGSNAKSNLVLLTPREHFIAHHLLYKVHTGKNKAKMAYAMHIMCSNNPNQQRQSNSRYYEYCRLQIAKSCTGVNSPNFGIDPYTPEQKLAMSIAKQGINNPMYGAEPWNKGQTGIYTQSAESNQKRSTSLKGKSRSIETCQKISAGLTGKPKSAAHKQKLADANIGKILSEETKQKMSASRKGTMCSTYICPQCGKEGKSSAMFRWHFDNCKL